MFSGAKRMFAIFGFYQLATGEMKLARNGRFEIGSSSVRLLPAIH